MRGKEYLLRYRKAIHAKDAALAELEEKQHTLSGLRAIQLSDMPKAHNHLRDLSDAFAAVEDSVKRCNTVISNAEQTMQEITDTLERIRNENQRIVLHMKYVRGYSWREMMIATGHSKTWIHTQHRAGLDAVDEIING